MTTNAEYKKPTKTIVPLAIGLMWGERDGVFQEKLDGRFETLTLKCGSVLAGEKMADGRFIAFDCLKLKLTDMRNFVSCSRLNAMQLLCGVYQIPMVKSSRNGGELLKSVLAAGGEGVVFKSDVSNYYTPMVACKRLETFLCVVESLNHATGGSTISGLITGENRGTVPLRNRSTLCKVGSIVKVEGEGLSGKGLIQKPRPCKDTETSWLVRF